MNHNILHICSINTNGLQQPEKRQRLIQWSIQQQYIVNARNYFFTNVLNQLMQDFEGSLYQSHGTSNLRGVAIWIKKNIEFKLIDEYKENEGRLLLIYVEINNAIYIIINIDAHNNMSKTNTFFKQVDRFIKEHIIGQIIPAGDYDILSKIDTTKSYRCKKLDTPVLSLKSMIKTHKLIDIWRQKNKTKTQFTWNRKDKFEATRIYYFLSRQIF
jgi:exonuclease III